MPNMKLGASYSTICERELLSKLLPLYVFDGPQTCRFWQRGVNDTYQVICGEHTYSLRVYRHKLRTLDAIRFEVAVLNHLHRRGVSVAYPLARQDGRYISEIQAPEGTRHVLVTAYANGSIPEYSELADASLYGASIAQLHNQSDDFVSDHTRPRLEIEYLLNTSLEVIKSFLTNNPDDLAYINAMAEELRKEVAGVAIDNLDVGLCHGDCHGGNVLHYIGELTHYDFDCCGFGLRVYDLATFKWGVMNYKNGDRLWIAFLDAYCEHRGIGEVDLSLVDTFVVIRHIWWMALLCGNVRDFGYSGHSDYFVQRQMRNIKKLKQIND